MVCYLGITILSDAHYISSLDAILYADGWSFKDGKVGRGEVNLWWYESERCKIWYVSLTDDQFARSLSYYIRDSSIRCCFRLWDRKFHYKIVLVKFCNICYSLGITLSTESVQDFKHMTFPILRIIASFSVFLENDFQFPVFRWLCKQHHDICIMPK